MGQTLKHWDKGIESPGQEFLFITIFVSDNFLARQLRKQNLSENQIGTRLGFASSIFFSVTKSPGKQDEGGSVSFSSQFQTVQSMRSLVCRKHIVMAGARGKPKLCPSWQLGDRKRGREGEGRAFKVCLLRPTLSSRPHLPAAA